MNAAVLNPLAQRAAWSLVHFLWQGVLLGLLAWGVLTFLKRRSPGLRYGVACVFLGICALLPVLSFAGLGISPGELEVQIAQSHGYQLLVGIRGRVQPLLPWVLVLWCLGSGMIAIRTLGVWFWLRRIRKRASEVLDTHCRECLDRLRGDAGVQRAVHLLESSWVHSPFTIGVLRPVILVPLGFFAFMDPLAAEAVLAHELAHIRRLDVLVIGLQAVIETLLFFHPVVWWLSRRVDTEREHCCDDVAVQACGDAVLFAQTLMRLDEDREPRLPLAPGATGGDLMERIKRLLKVDSGPLRITAPSLSLILGLSLTATALVAREEPVKQTLGRAVVLAESILGRVDVEARGTVRGLAALSPQQGPAWAPDKSGGVPQEEVSPVVFPSFQRAALGSETLPYTVLISAQMSEPDVSTLAAVPEATLPEGPKVDPSYYGENRGLREVEWLKRPVPDGEGRTFSDWNFTLGHATYHLSGRATYFRAGGVIRGFYFVGDGRVDYATTDAVEIPAARYLLHEHTLVKSKLVGDALHIQDEVREGLFWFAGSEVPAMPGVATPGAGAKFLPRMATLLESDLEPFQQELALRVLGSTDKSYTRVQFQGRSRFWRHTVDARDAERFEVNRQRLMDRSFYRPMVLISRQPITWSHRAPKMPPFALTAMDADVTALDEFSGRVLVTQTYLPLQDGLKTLDLTLPNRYWSNRGLVKGDVTLRLKVSSVSDAEGHALAFDHSSGGLLVAVPGMARKVPVTLRIQIEGEMFNTVEEASGESSWVPMPKDPAAKVFTLKVHGQAKTPWRILTPGDPMRIWTEGGMNHVEARFDRPVQEFSASLWRPLQQWEQETDTVQGSAITYLRAPGTMRQESLHALNNSLLEREVQTLEQLLGPLPFQQFSAPPGADMGQLSLNDLMDTGTYFGKTGGFTGRYWGQVAKPWNDEDAWMVRALPLYCNVLARKNWVRNGQLQFQQSLTEWFRRAERAKGAGAIATAARIQAVDGDYLKASYSSDLLVSKGICLLYTLHLELGDELFSKFLQTCLSVASYQPFSTATMPVILKEVTGKDYGAFFDTYFWGTGVMKQPALTPAATPQK